MVELHFSLVAILLLVMDLKVYQEILLDKGVFDNLISVDVWLAKALRRFATGLLVNNELRGKVVSSTQLPIIFDDNLKIISISFFYC